jgi:AraC-like DNA-binding protein
MNETCPTLKRIDLFRKGENFFIHNSKDLPEYVSKTHRHDFVEIAYVLSGECEHVENDISYVCKKGDLYIVNYMVPHSDIVISSEPFVTYDCAFSPDFIDASLSGANDFINVQSSFLFKTVRPSQIDFNPSISLSDSPFNEIKTLFEKMFNEYSRQSKGYIDLLRAYMIELLILIFRKIDRGYLPSEEKPYIESALQYIRDNYTKHISLADIAYRSFTSKNYFSTLFKNAIGVSFSNYLQKVRIEKACELLETTDMSIESIVNATGFCDYKFFHNVFKKLKSSTPGEYRRLHRNV